MTHALAPVLRKQLEKAVRAARAEGEAGARAALGALAVDAVRPHESMSVEERGLRRRLRAHGRQLGDARDQESGAQEIGRLVHEVAYEHWHRMLFARFLAENGLLVEPRSRVSVSLEECAELAREAGATDGWQVAERFAAEMLPRIFRPDDPALAVTLAPETRQRLERLVEELPAGVFTASDALGWTYQFWQADRKEEVNRSGAKIGADELPAVTQLFTENYMVRFLFHNTIGAWRAGKVLAEQPELAAGASTEAELMAATRLEPRGGLDGYDFEYLRFVREPACDAGEDAIPEPRGAWRPAAGGEVRGLGVPRASTAGAALKGRFDAVDAADHRARVAADTADADADVAAAYAEAASASADLALAAVEAASDLSGTAVDGTAEADLASADREARLARDAADVAGVQSSAARRVAVNLAGTMLATARAEWRATRAISSAAAAVDAARLTFRGWPRRAADLRVLDPCCGSGHFLVEGLELLVRLRMEEEGLGVEDAVGAVLRDNLFGLEIDQRCTQIAAFNLALTAWKMVGRPIDLPPLRIACSGLAVSASKDDWVELAEGDQRLEGTLDRLHDLFKQGPVLGSLIDPAGVGEELFQADYATAERALSRAVAQEDAGEEVRERAVAAQGMSRAAGLLAGEYDLVITNVPYLARGKQAANLQDFAVKSHPDAKADLATLFVSRTLRWLGAGGVQAVVAPQNWLFLTSYRKLRERLLAERTWRFVARLGEHAFESTTAAGAFAAMTVISAEGPDDAWRMAGIDVSAPRGEKPIPAREKAKLLRTRPEPLRTRASERAAVPGTAVAPAVAREPERKPESQQDVGATSAPSASTVRLVPQSSVAAGPDSRIVLRPAARSDLLERFADAPNGMHAGDSARFRRCYWELRGGHSEWRFFQRPLLVPRTTRGVSTCSHGPMTVESTGRTRKLGFRVRALGGNEES